MEMATIDIVVKIGGGTLPHTDAFARVLDAVAMAAARTRLAIVPGGGAFADAVRDADRRVGLTPDAAHWMAVLAMDQYAWLVADKLPRAMVVDSEQAIGDALRTAHVPVLAVSRWLRRADPLPHSWDVTSDSIAGWVASALGARRLVLIKPPGAAGDRLVDRYFADAVPAALEVRVLPADRIVADDIA
jgi:aspartokinase-like uncharacterized kinase